MEDAGALTGLVLALAAVTAAAATGNSAFDAVGTIAIGALLISIAVFLMIEMKGLLIGEGARPADERAIRDALESPANVVRLIHLRTQHLGPDDLLVGAKIALAPDLTLVEVAETIDAAEAALRQAVAAARIVYIEPDVLAER